MKRIIMHWTAGRHMPNRVDKAAYHRLYDGDGNVHLGDLPIGANESTNGEYAAHTLNLNTGSIGVACCAMWNANEVPFDWGDAPLTEAQIEAMCRDVAKLCDEYAIPVTRKTVLTHAEVHTTLGVAQRWKWDFKVLPGMAKPGNALGIGDTLRARIKAYREELDPVAPPAQEIPEGFFFELISGFLKRLFK